MPSASPLPTVSDFLRAYDTAIRGTHGGNLSVRRGGTFDLVGGSSALIWARESTRDRDVFRQVYADSATESDLDRIVQRRYGVTRSEASYGTGNATFARPTAAAGLGTIYRGTRILVRKNGLPVSYAVAANTDISGSATSVLVPIRATVTGTGVAVSASTSELKLDDAIFDSSLVPTSLTCGDGTSEETPAAYLARARKSRHEERIGYASAVERACRAAGAVNIVILDAGVYGQGPDENGDNGDSGVTNVYVADGNFTTTDGMITACMLAIDDARVAGCDTQVLGMEITPVSMTVDAVLWDSPGEFDVIALKELMLGALLDSFNRRPKFWLFDLNTLRGEIVHASDFAVQSATISTSPSPPSASFVATLPRYTLAGSDVTFTLTGPQ